MVLEKNLFVEAVLPGSVLRGLTEAEMEVYRRPFREPGEGRRPTLTWPRQIPIEDEPADVCEIVDGYGAWLSESDVPKLFFCRGWPNQHEVTVKGVHFVQEDSPDEIGQAVADWYQRLG
jgi:haloalkane dehalogenase